MASGKLRRFQPSLPRLEWREQRVVSWSFADRNHPQVFSPGEVDRGQGPERRLEQRKAVRSLEPLEPSHATIPDRSRRAEGSRSRRWAR